MGMFDPRKMKQLMKSMGIEMKEVPATEVIIKTQEKRIVITNPQVTEIEQKGLKIYQILGDVKVEEDLEEDIKLIMEQTGASREEAEKALKETGDLAAAILKLTESHEQ